MFNESPPPKGNFDYTALLKQQAEFVRNRLKEDQQKRDWHKQSELRRHLDFYRCLNMSKGPYCE